MSAPIKILVRYAIRLEQHHYFLLRSANGSAFTRVGKQPKDYPTIQGPCDEQREQWLADGRAARQLGVEVEHVIIPPGEPLPP